MKIKYIAIAVILLCFFISLAGASANDMVDMENITSTNDEMDSEVSKNIETIDDLDSEIKNAAANSTIMLDRDI